MDAKALLKKGSLKLANGLFLRGTVLSDNSLAIVTDKAILVLNSSLDKDSKQVFDLDKLKLKKPRLIATNKSGKILITDNETGCLNLYNSRFEFETTRNESLGDYCEMTVDNDTDEIYLVKPFGLEYSKGYKIKHLTSSGSKSLRMNNQNDSEDFRPRSIKVVDDKIYITNAVSVRLNPVTRQFEETTIGENCIYIFHKSSFELYLKINLNDQQLIQPWSLFVDKNSNIYTTAFMLDNQVVSKERYLFKINEKLENCGAMKECNFLTQDLLYFDNKIVAIFETELISYDFNNI